MRKAALLILAVLVSAAASADRVPLQKAGSLASGFFGTRNEMEQVSVPAVRVPGRGQQTAGQEYYIFNNPSGGWVIIAADDRVTPLLAYSDTGSFPSGNLAPGLEYWLGQVSASVLELDESGIKADERITEMWNAMSALDSAPDSGESSVIETAKWGQDYPYNMYCPVAPIDIAPAVTGCLATAMGIVMRHYSWPQHGTGVIGGYVSGSGMNSVNIPSYSIDTHEYDWDSMPLTSASKRWSARNRSAVATLLHDCGVMVCMEYGESGSSAYSADVVRPLVEHMSYSSGASQILRAGYTSDSWFSAIRSEIDAGRLVLYSAVCEEGGHAFVCDGYDTAGNMLHINWGWDGYANAFYSMDLMVEDLTFNSNQAAVIGIAPSSEPVGKTEPRVTAAFGMLSPGLSFSATRMGPDGDAEFVAYYLSCSGAESFTTALKVCLMDADGVEREQVTDEEPVTVDTKNGRVFTLESSMTLTPQFTDYFQLFYRRADGTWAPVTLDQSKFDEGSLAVCGVTSDPLVVAGSHYSAGDVLELKLTRGDMPVTSCQWTFDGAPAAAGKVTLHSGENVIQAHVTFSDDSKSVITKKINIE